MGIRAFRLSSENLVIHVVSTTTATELSKNLLYCLIVFYAPRGISAEIFSREITARKLNSNVT